MPVPGLIDTYAFADWLKTEYSKVGRPRLLITPEHGGLLTVQLSDYEELESLLEELVDEEVCHYDHHDYCQTHFLAMRPCPYERARHRRCPHPPAQHTEAVKVKFEDESPAWVVGAEEEMP